MSAPHILPAPFAHVEDHLAPRPRTRFRISPALALCLGLYALTGAGAAAAVDQVSGGRMSAPQLVASAALWPAFVGAAVVRAGHKQ